MRTARSEFVLYLRQEVAALKDEVARKDRIIMQLVMRPPLTVPADPIVVQPAPQPDLAELARGMGEAFATTLNGQTTVEKLPQMDEEFLRKVMQDMDEVNEGIVYPDIEFDDTMDPNPPSAHVPVGPDQSPVHAVVNGKVRRMDGTPMFMSGEGLSVPPGGVE